VLAKLMRNLSPDLRPLRVSRNFRLLMLGGLVTGIGTQATLIALPYQVYVLTHSAFLTGLLGAVELGPLIVSSLYAGAFADRMDRRRLLLLCQIALVVIAASLGFITLIGVPRVWVLFVLAGLIAGAAAVERVARQSIVPNTVGPEHLKSALSMSFGLMQVTMVVGPTFGGLVIEFFGLAVPYFVDAVSVLGMVAAAWALSPQPPPDQPRAPTIIAIRSGLGFVSRLQGLMASFVIDLLAMTFGMPRALFPILSIEVFHTGAFGAGILNSAVAAGATVAALTTGWMGSARRLGRIVLGAVAVWGLAIAAAGFMTSLWPAAVLFALAGAADSVSAVCRTTITQTLTPDAMRGRVSAVFSLVVASGPRLGDVESGTVAAVTSPKFSVVSGGLACLVSVAAIAVWMPGLAAYDSERAQQDMQRAHTAHIDAEAARAASG
jgi:MFS family permease